jgi:RimJ/RimL family protein N-acetyltransferase
MADCPPLDVRPVTLEGRVVSLEPLELAHLEGLCEVGLDPLLWTWTVAAVRDAQDMERYVADALAARAAGTAMPFVIRDRSTGRLVGSTRYLAIDRDHCRLEIGWTWVAAGWQGTAVNAEAKLLLLGHAFDQLGCRRVEFKTDALNQRSRAALRAIGAREEGTLRKHMIGQGGRPRDSVYFSVIDSEWPAVRQALVQRVNRLAAIDRPSVPARIPTD